MWDITIRPNFFYPYTLHFLLLQSSFVVTVVIETDSRIFLVSELLLEVPSEEKVCAPMLGITLELDEHKGRSGSRIFIFLDTRAFLVHSDFF